MNKKLQYVLLIAVCVIPASVIYFGIDDFLKFISRIGFENSQESGAIIFSLVLTYVGTILMNKIVIIAASFVTEKYYVLKFITITITFFALMFVISNMENYKLDISNNDKGILFEIVGFFIFLNPINKYLANFFKDKNDLFIDHELIVKTTSVTLVVIGLIMQLSTFI